MVRIPKYAAALLLAGSSVAFAQDVEITDAPDPAGSALRPMGVNETAADVLKRYSPIASQEMKALGEGVAGVDLPVVTEYMDFFGLRQNVQATSGATYKAVFDSEKGGEAADEKIDPNVWSGSVTLSEAGNFFRRKAEGGTIRSEIFSPGAEVAWDRRMNTRNSLHGQYTFGADMSSLDNSDSLAHTIAFSWVYALILPESRPPKWGDSGRLERPAEIKVGNVTFDLLLNDTFKQKIEDPLGNTFSVRSRINYQHNSWGKADFSYTYSLTDSLVDGVPSRNDADGSTHSAGFSEMIYVGSLIGRMNSVNVNETTPIGTGALSDLNVRFSYAHSWQDTDGRNVEAQADSFLFGIAYTIPKVGLNVNATYRHSCSRSRNENTLTGIRAAIESDKASIQFTYSFLRNLPTIKDHDSTGRLSIFAQYDFSEKDANLRAVEAVNHLVTAGIVWKF